MLIDSEPLIRRYARKMRLALEDGHPRTASDYASRIKDLMQAPEAVVHCKDCKWYSNGECVSNDIWCYKIDGDREGVLLLADPDDFCPYGERKEEVTR